MYHASSLNVVLLINGHLNHCKKQFYYCKFCKRVFKSDEKEKQKLSYPAEYECPLCNETIISGKFGLSSHTKNECLMNQLVLVMHNILDV